MDLTAAGPGLGQLAAQLEAGTDFKGYEDVFLRLEGCRVVGLLQGGQPVETVSGTGEGPWTWLDGGGVPRGSKGSLSGNSKKSSDVLVVGYSLQMTSNVNDP